MDKQFIDRIKSAVNIEEVIGSYISLKKAGVNYKGKCPFHADNTPSFIVSPVKQIYTCFPCGATGDVIEFVKQYNNIPFIEAVKAIADTVHIPIPTESVSKEELEHAKEREALHNALARTQLIFESNRAHPEYAAYLKERGISEHTASAFGLGFAPLNNNLIRDGVPEKQARILELVKQSQNGRVYDCFRNRIMYPFYSQSGKIVGFTGRALNWSKHDKFPKYLNSSESDVFHKEQLLFGLRQANQAIRREDRAIIVEGQNDVLAMHQFEHENTICSSGTSFTTAQAKVIMRFTKRFTLLFDGDDAGRMASNKAIIELLKAGAEEIRVHTLPLDEDPDSWVRTIQPQESKRILANAIPFYHHILLNMEYTPGDAFIQKEHLNATIPYITAIQCPNITKASIQAVATKLRLSVGDIKKLLPNSPKTTNSLNGFLGIDDAKELAEKEKVNVHLTFSTATYYEHFGEKPIILFAGEALQHQARTVASQISVIDADEFKFTYNAEGEDSKLQILRMLFESKVTLTMIPSNQPFIDWYIGKYANILAENRHVDDKPKSKQENDADPVKHANSKSIPVRFLSSSDIPIILSRCVEMIACLADTQRTLRQKDFAKMLDITVGQLKEALKPLLHKRKNRAAAELERLEMLEKGIKFEFEGVPAYVLNDDKMRAVYNQFRFYPLLNKDKEEVAYVFLNDKGTGHTRLSDFYMEPLLHVTSAIENIPSRRVIQIKRIDGGKLYVEFPSTVFTKYEKLEEKLIDIPGAYNFNGTKNQYKQIWETMSHNFIGCTEISVFGRQKQGFWAYNNAIHYLEDGKEKIDIANPLGIVEYKGVSYYFPAFSYVNANHSTTNDPYKHDRFMLYKELPASDRLTFEQWAHLMDKVYHLNSNGKWAVLFAIMCCFRDFIHGSHGFFTSLFFVGPPSSGKTKVAFSVRSLFMTLEAQSFNLNSSSDAAFFYMLERYCNVPIVFEEYKDTISNIKFEGLKAGVLDGQGRTNVKDAASRKLNISDITAVPVLLGQEAPQRDGASLTTRIVLCPVPLVPKGEWKEDEVERFNLLKNYERAGLGNVLAEVLNIRPIVERKFNGIYTEELKLIKQDVFPRATNTEGLARITETVTFFTTIMRLVQEHTTLRLPFCYDEFFALATDKIVIQMESIAKGDRLTTFFDKISFLLSQKVLLMGKQLKVAYPPNGEITRITTGKNTEKINVGSGTKVLYIDLTSIYPLYEKTERADNAISISTLIDYFKSHDAYIGRSKGTYFSWLEEKRVPRMTLEEYNNDVSEMPFGTVQNKKDMHMQIIMEKVSKNTNAYMFNYDKLKEMMDVDFKLTNTDEEEPDVNNTKNKLF